MHLLSFISLSLIICAMSGAGSINIPVLTDIQNSKYLSNTKEVEYSNLDTLGQVGILATLNPFIEYIEGRSGEFSSWILLVKE